LDAAQVEEVNMGEMAQPDARCIGLARGPSGTCVDQKKLSTLSGGSFLSLSTIALDAGGGHQRINASTLANIALSWYPFTTVTRTARQRVNAPISHFSPHRVTCPSKSSPAARPPVTGHPLSIVRSITLITASTWCCRFPLLSLPLIPSVLPHS
jgi:hypothetical protein